MKIILYKSIVEPHCVDKSNNLKSKKEYNNCTLRDESSVVDPDILINSTSNLSSYNYCYIPDFNRYYFINNVTSVRNGIWSLSLHVDVLMSYKSDFLKLNAIISRQENASQDVIDNGVTNAMYNNGEFVTQADSNLRNIYFDKDKSVFAKGDVTYLLTCF